MLKKGISSFLLFILVLCSFHNISSADVVKETVNKSFYAYNESVFTSQKSNEGQQYGPQTLNVKEKRSNGWWKIQTWEGDKWINLEGEIKYFDKSFLTFYEPSFGSMRGNMEIAYNPQNLNVVDGNTLGWLKVQTWEGDQWMYPGVAETVTVNENFYVYNEPSFTADKGAGGNQFGPQKFLPILEKRQDGWWKVVTYEGPKWTAIQGVKVQVQEDFFAFSTPNLDSNNIVASFAPQTVTVFEGDSNGWLLIQTYLGKYWINPILDSKKKFSEGKKNVQDEINYPGDEVATEKHKQIYVEQKPIRDALLNGTRTVFWPEPGDILLTTDTNPSLSGYGIFGHVGMMLDPMTVMHIGGPGETPSWMPSNGWFERYKNTVLLRWKDRAQAKNAAQWVWDYYIVGPGKNTGYFPTPGVFGTNKTYCSELVYQGFYYGAGLHLLNPVIEATGIVLPYDFLYMKGFSHVKLPYSVNIEEE